MPGRLAAHLTGCNTYSFRTLQFLVVDEADRVLSGSFHEALEVIGRFLDQRYILCADYDRDMVLTEMLRKFKEEHEDANVIIFTNSKKDYQVLSMTLNSIGFDNVCRLHGFLRQIERGAALNRFKSKHVRILIATDVASRGLDFPTSSWF